MAPSKKTMLFVCLLVATSAMVVPASAQFGLGDLLNFLRIGSIQGILFCSGNGTATVGSNGTIISPPFSNATVQLRCGSGNGTVISTGITSSTGQISIPLNILSFSLSQILSGCRLVVATPLAQCNVTLPSVGTLTSNLIRNGTITIGGINIPILSPIGFTLT
ncbi:phylloplanin-like [Argentina anserina]|uniref:phylloplanin-like n=1 Tax=Argentina anserina TaxID=57926 RepID=UPI00217623CF|nr:phylloplanin-like [Potentilla anserina]